MQAKPKEKFMINRKGFLTILSIFLVSGLLASCSGFNKEKKTTFSQARTPKNSDEQIKQIISEFLTEELNGADAELDLLASSAVDKGNYFDITSTVYFGNQQKMVVTQYDPHMNEIFNGSTSLMGSQIELNVEVSAMCNTQTCENVLVVLDGYSRGLQLIQKTFIVNQAQSLVMPQSTYSYKSLLETKDAMEELMITAEMMGL